MRMGKSELIAALSMFDNVYVYEVPTKQKLKSAKSQRTPEQVSELKRLAQEKRDRKAKKLMEREE